MPVVVKTTWLLREVRRPDRGEGRQPLWSPATGQPVAQVGNDERRMLMQETERGSMQALTGDGNLHSSGDLPGSGEGTACAYVVC
jgi:hypothetical protein